MPQPTVITPKRGPRQVYHFHPEARTVTVMAVLRVGSRDEEHHERGISHILEHMVFKGTKSYPKAEDISRLLEAMGASYNAYTSKETTVFYAKAEARHLDALVSVIADLAFRPALRASDWEREKQVIVEELKMYEENPQSKVEMIVDEAHFGDTPLGVSIGGSPESVRGISAAQVRRFWQKHYAEGDCTVVVAGKFSAPKAKALVKKHFPHGRSHAVPVPAKEISPFIAALRSKTMPNEQVQLMASWPGVGIFEKDYPVYRLLASIMGGGMSSRLFSTVREKHGLAYSVGMGLQSYADVGQVILQAGVDASRLQKAVAVIGRELKRMVAKGPSPKELREMKSNVRGRRAIKLEDYLEEAEWYAQQAVWNRTPRDPDAYLAEIDRVTAAQIKTLAKRIFSQKPALAVVGPKESVDAMPALQKIVG